MTIASRLSVVIDGDATRLVGSLNQAGIATKSFERGILRSSGVARGAFGRIIPYAASSAAIAVGAMAYSVARDTFELNQKLAQVAALSNASAADVANWTDAIRGLSEETARSPVELADALYFLASAGLSNSQVLPTLEAAAKAAAVGMGTTADTAKIAAQAMNAYSDSGLTATQVFDTLTAAIKAGIAEPDEFAKALGRILPIASRAGVAFNDVVASLAQLSNAGLKVDEGVTAMRGALRAIIAPGDAAAEAMGALGLSSDQLLRVIQNKGLLAALRLLDQRAKENSSTQAEYIGILDDVIPNVRSLTGVLSLTGQEAAKVDKTFEDVANATGELGASFEETKAFASFQISQDWITLKNVFMDIGQNLLPLVAGGLHMIVDVLHVFEPVTDILVGMWQVLKVLTPLIKAAAIAWTGWKIVTYVTTAIKALDNALSIQIPRRMVATGLAMKGMGMEAAGATLMNKGLGLALSGVARFALGAVFVAGILKTAWDASSHSADALKAKTQQLTESIEAQDSTLEPLRQQTGLVDDEFRAWLNTQTIFNDTADAAANAWDNYRNSFTPVLQDILTAKNRFTTVSINVNTLTGEVVTAGKKFSTSFDLFGDSLLKSTKLTNSQKIQLAGMVDTLYDMRPALTETREEWLKNQIEAGHFTRVITFINDKLPSFAQNLRDVATAADLTDQQVADLNNTTGALASIMGQSVDDLKAAGTEAWVKDTKKWGENWDQFVSGVLSKVDEFKQGWSDSINQVSTVMGELIDKSKEVDSETGKVLAANKLSPQKLLQGFKDAAKATRQYGQDINEISEIADGAGADLATWVAGLGEDAPAVAALIADSSGSMQEAMVTAFDKSGKAADSAAEKMQKQILGTMTDIENLLKFLVTGNWKFVLKAFGVDSSKRQLDSLQRRVLALTGHTWTINVDVQGNQGIPPVLDEDAHRGGLITSGGPTMHTGGPVARTTPPLPAGSGPRFHDGGSITDYAPMAAAADAQDSPTMHLGGHARSGLARGGSRRPGLSSDEVPVILQIGEYVVRKRAVRAYGVENLRQINRMSTRRDREMLETRRWRRHSERMAEGRAPGARRLHSGGGADRRDASGAWGWSHDSKGTNYRYHDGGSVTNVFNSAPRYHDGDEVTFPHFISPRTIRNFYGANEPASIKAQGDVPHAAREGLGSAVAEWNHHAARKVFESTGGTPDVVVHMVKDVNRATGADDGVNAFARGTLANIWYEAPAKSWDWPSLSYRVKRSIYQRMFAHEMGHTLGIGHPSTSVTRATGNDYADDRFILSGGLHVSNREGNIATQVLYPDTHRAHAGGRIAAAPAVVVLHGGGVARAAGGDTTRATEGDRNEYHAGGHVAHRLHLGGTVMNVVNAPRFHDGGTTTATALTSAPTSPRDVPNPYEDVKFPRLFSVARTRRAYGTGNPVTVHLRQDGSRAASMGLDKAVHRWNEAAQIDLFSRGGRIDVQVNPVDPSGKYMGVGGKGTLGRIKYTEFGKNSPFTVPEKADIYATLFAHEMGHTLGFAHPITDKTVADNPNKSNPYGDRRFILSGSSGRVNPYEGALGRSVIYPGVPYHDVQRKHAGGMMGAPAALASVALPHAPRFHDGGTATASATGPYSVDNPYTSVRFPLLYPVRVIRHAYGTQEPVTIKIDRDAPQAASIGLARAVHGWNEASNVNLFAQTGGNAEVMVHTVKAKDRAALLGDAAGRSNIGDIWYWPTHWKDGDAENHYGDLVTTFQTLFQHEMGHTIGFNHPKTYLTRGGTPYADPRFALSGGDKVSRYEGALGRSVIYPDVSYHRGGRVAGAPAAVASVTLPRAPRFHDGGYATLAAAAPRMHDGGATSATTTGTDYPEVTRQDLSDVDFDAYISARRVREAYGRGPVVTAIAGLQNVPDKYRDAVRQGWPMAVQDWNRAANKRIFVAGGGKTDVTVQVVKGIPKYSGLGSLGRARVDLDWVRQVVNNPDLYPEPKLFLRYAYKRVMAHELGHTIGISHPTTDLTRYAHDPYADWRLIMSGGAHVSKYEGDLARAVVYGTGNPYKRFHDGGSVLASRSDSHDTMNHDGRSYHTGGAIANVTNQAAKVPALAAGGVARGPMVVGEGFTPTFAGPGAEVVLPLDTRGISVLAEAVERGTGGDRHREGGGYGQPDQHIEISIRPDRTRLNRRLEMDYLTRGR